MDVDLALLCDAATIDGSGKLNILGVFDRIGVQQFPARHGRLCLVVRVTAGVQEAGTHPMVITLEGPDGEEMVRADGQLQIGAGPTAAREGIKVPQIINFDGVMFEKGGQYRFDISVDGVHHVSVPLHVVAGGGGAQA